MTSAGLGPTALIISGLPREIAGVYNLIKLREILFHRRILDLSGSPKSGLARHKGGWHRVIKALAACYSPRALRPLRPRNEVRAPGWAGDLRGTDADAPTNTPAQTSQTQDAQTPRPGEGPRFRAAGERERGTDTRHILKPEQGTAEDTQGRSSRSTAAATTTTTATTIATSPSPTHFTFPHIIGHDHVHDPHRTYPTPHTMIAAVPSFRAAVARPAMRMARPAPTASSLFMTKRGYAMPQTNSPTSAYAKQPEADGKYLVTLG